jgi:ribonuclease P protein component
LRVLKTRDEFLAAAKGVRAHRPNLSLQRRDRGDGEPARVGYTVTKKEGGSVERNRIRRRLREVARLVVGRDGAPGADYVVIGRRAALDSPFQTLVQDLKEALAEAAKRAARGAKAPRPKHPDADIAPDARQG